MFPDRVNQIRGQFREFIQSYYGVEAPELTVEIPPRIELGDLALPFPLQMARTLRKAPRQIAQEVVEQIGPLECVRRMEAAPPGFINLFLDRARIFRELHDQVRESESESSDGKVIVEHTNINPNKAAHIGHLRNAVLGDTCVRLMRSQGRSVEVQNYIDNTGVQVADVIVGFHFLRGLDKARVEAIPEPFDYYCWDLYAEVSEWFEADKSRVELRHQVLAAIEHGEEPFFPLAEHISGRIVRAHLATMERLGVRYDVLPRESEILHLHFWDDAFCLLKEKKAIYFSEEGSNKGCWVMNLPGEGAQPDEVKIIVRSNGTVTYVGKDIAYQLWKFGLLGRTFHYHPFHTYADGQVVWETSTVPGADDEPTFGGGSLVYNVIDVRQAYLQRVVVQGLRNLGYEDEASRSIHFSYEMVALSPGTCRELGIELSEEDKLRPYVEVSGRKGLGVKADDLIDKLIEKSLQEVERRQQDLAPEQRHEIARQIAVGALRYFMLKYTRNSVIAFDFDEALSFEGETGPYLQYSIVRSNNIFRKLAERQEAWEGSRWSQLRSELWGNPEIEEWMEDDGVWGLLRELARTDDAIAQAIDSLELSGAAKHAFSLAQQFNLFYHSHHILSDENELRKAFHLTITDTVRRGLVRLLDLLGIAVPERM
jgi:arginyl-tRNA synthetase